MIALKDSLGSDFVERVRAIFAPGRPAGEGAQFRISAGTARRWPRRSRRRWKRSAISSSKPAPASASRSPISCRRCFSRIEKKKKAIVSTHTINLQEQLLHKDIPIVKKILPVEFEAALMKGRQNYLCPRRLERALQQANELFNTTEQADLARLADWARTTTDGTLSDLPIEPDPKVWTQVCSEAHICTTKTCGQNPRCFFQQARKRLLAADVVVINHTLLFMLLGSPEEQEEREEGYLFPNDFIIFDEAHTIEQVASRQIGIGISQYGLRATIQRLYNARSKKGLFTVTRDAAGVTLAASLVDEADRFFAAIDERANFKKEAANTASAKRILSTTRLPGAWPRSRRASAKWSARPRTNSSSPSCRNSDGALARRAKASRFSCNRAREEYVYWIERTGKTAQNITLNAAPIDVAPVLRRMLFRDDCASVMTSATLAVGRPDLAYFRRRIGADEAEPLQLGSPFDFQKQMKLFVVRKMPDPRDDGYSAALAEWVARFVEDTDGRAFVLFTSYRSMQQLALEMEDFFASRKMNLLVQGKGAPRSQLLEQFKTTPRSVLFGTDSFWMGVDVPGDALSNVIITRLPFAVPGSSIDRGEARTHPGTRRRCLHGIFAPGSDPEIPPGRRPLDSDQERQRHRRHSRQSGRDEDLRPRLS